MLVMSHGSGHSTPKPPIALKKPMEPFAFMDGASSTTKQDELPEAATAGSKLGQSELYQRKIFKRRRLQQENGTGTCKGIELKRQASAGKATARKSIHPKKVVSLVHAEVVRELQLDGFKGGNMVGSDSVREAVNDRLKGVAVVGPSDNYPLANGDEFPKTAEESHIVSATSDELEVISSEEEDYDALETGMGMAEKCLNNDVDEEDSVTSSSKMLIILENALLSSASGDMESSDVRATSATSTNLEIIDQTLDIAGGGRANVVERIVAEHTDSDVNDAETAAESDDQEHLWLENPGDEETEATLSSSPPETEIPIKNAAGTNEACEPKINETELSKEQESLEEDAPMEQTGLPDNGLNVNTAEKEVGENCEEMETELKLSSSEQEEVIEHPCGLYNSLLEGVGKDVTNGNVLFTHEKLETAEKPIDGYVYKEKIEAEEDNKGKLSLELHAVIDDNRSAESPETELAAPSKPEKSHDDVSNVTSEVDKRVITIDLSSSLTEIEPPIIETNEKRAPVEHSETKTDTVSNKTEEVVKPENNSEDEPNKSTMDTLDGEDAITEVPAAVRDQVDIVLNLVVEAPKDVLSDNVGDMVIVRTSVDGVQDTDGLNTVDAKDTIVSRLTGIPNRIEGEICAWNLVPPSLKRKKPSQEDEATHLSLPEETSGAKKRKSDVITEQVVGQNIDDKDSEVLQLTKAELRVLIVQKVKEFFNDDVKNEVAALRHRCVGLEKNMERWRRKAGAYQKQMIEQQTTFQRALQRLSINHRNENTVVTGPNAGPQANVGQRPATISPRAGGSLQRQPGPCVTSLGTTNALTSSPGHRATAASINHSLQNVCRVQQQGPLTIGQIRPRAAVTAAAIVNAQKKNGVGRLHSRTSALMSGSSMTITRTGGVASSKTSSLRTSLDDIKMNAANSAPVPMRLMANEVGPSTIGVQRPVDSSLQQLATASVNLIDLTADEDSGPAQRQLLQVVSRAQTTLVDSSSAVGVIPSVMSPANTITVLNTSAKTTSGHILTISSGRGNSTAIRMTGGQLRPATTVPQVSNTGQSQLAYLLQDSHLKSVRQPTSQPVFVPTTEATRDRPQVPTFVLQSGATLVPIQQGQVLPARRAALLASQGSTISTQNVVITPQTAVPLATTSYANQMPVMRVASSMGVFGTTSLSLCRLTNVPEPTATGRVIAKTVFPPVEMLPSHPAPLPTAPKYPENSGSDKKLLPPKPFLKISKSSNGIVLSWNMHTNISHSEVSSYQLFSYQEDNAAPCTTLWKKVGDIKALPLPMACTLTQFVKGHKYHFAVRAVDISNRFGAFSDPGSITLNKP